ncbi:hypothetical protein GE09DRAFT_1093034 [Coniochaeta sp. 2T2.1]|nr:hypothetical protein GE09DRAFT_1093034 [Coniochaeta sp. 2T2.1]
MGSLSIILTVPIGQSYLHGLCASLPLSCPSKWSLPRYVSPLPRSSSGESFSHHDGCCCPAICDGMPLVFCKRLLVTGRDWGVLQLHFLSNGIDTYDSCLRRHSLEQLLYYAASARREAVRAVVSKHWSLGGLPAMQTTN